MKRLLIALATLVGVAVVCVVSVGWLLVHPVQTRIRNPPTDLNAESVVFPSESGAEVHAWWCPTQNSRGAVLLLPGIRANRLSMLDRARFLRRAGYSVLLIDFQATGETKGDHITFGWKESRDVLAAVDFVRRVDPAARVAIIVSSLGCVAVLLATPPLKVDALVLEEVYPTIEIATRNRMENYLGVVGRVLTPLLLNQMQSRLGVSASQLRPIAHIACVECPMLIISGEKDRNTRPFDTQMLVERARSPKKLWFVPNAGHVDLHQASRVAYESRILAFLRKM
ncbi:MAG TPA: alpha/beta fold hydrolase [Candidatus Udaeobacter sp.]|nr:alpha/beta fold hydrolase [Candidatus Udaeobacter sp.]